MDPGTTPTKKEMKEVMAAHKAAGSTLEKPKTGSRAGSQRGE
jgi:hypothetical protein